MGDRVSHGGQGDRVSSSHHPLPPREHISRQLELGAQTRLRPRHFNMGCKCPKRRLECCAKAQPSKRVS